MKRLLQPLLIFVLIVGTIGNGAVLARTYQRSQRTETTTTPPQAAIVPKVKIQDEKVQKVVKNRQGARLSSGRYKFETLDHSKIKEGGNGHLVLANHAASNAHFILALGSDSGLSSKDVQAGWKLQPINDDPAWQPGACSSKPTELIKGRYIVIDDGLSDPKDKYNSYIVFDIQTGKFKYFGGNSFTKDQAENENIFKMSNENGELVLYIDLKDEDQINKKNGSFEHTTGQENGYIIRRVVDPRTMRFKDYKLTYSVPTGISKYTLSNTGYSDTRLVSLSSSARRKYVEYIGTSQNNKIVFTTRVDDPDEGDKDTALELALNNRLKKLLPKFIGKPYKGSKATTHFVIEELGSYKSTKFLRVRGRYPVSHYKLGQTPLVYSSVDKSLSPLTTQLVLDFSNYVLLGVY